MARTILTFGEITSGNVVGNADIIYPINYNRIYNTSSLSLIESYYTNQFNPNVNDLFINLPAVEAMALSGSNLYIGGSFTTVSGSTRNKIAAVDKDSGALLPFDPDIDLGGIVYDLLISDSALYIAGLFTTASGSTRNCLAAVDKDSGTLLPFDPNTDSVYCMAISGSNLYIGGGFTTVSGSARNCLAAVNKDSGALLPFNPNAGSVNIIVISGSNLYIGGDFINVSGSVRNRLACVNKDSGALLPFNPNVNGTINSLVISDSNLYLGGLFTTVSGSTRNSLAAVNKDSGALLPFNPNTGIGSYITSLAISGSNLYIGGEFETISGSTRSRIAVVDKNSGALDIFNTGVPGFNGTIRSLLISEPFLYLGGEFTSISGSTRNELASINLYSGKLDYLITNRDDYLIYYQDRHLSNRVRNESSYRESFLICGRKENNWQFAITGSRTNYIQVLNNSGSYENNKPIQIKKSNLLINRFNSPGDINSNKLDIESSEYSVYNQINMRNLKIRNEFNLLLSKPSLFGGIQSGSN